MPTQISTIETRARRRLLETTANYWTSANLVDIVIDGIRDLWRSIVDLKQEYYLKIDITNVSLPADTARLLGVPQDVHKVYLIEPRDTTTSGAHRKLIFTPQEYNSDIFSAARSSDDIDPAAGGEIFYSPVGEGAPVGAPAIEIAPEVTAAVNLRFGYVPVLGELNSNSFIPIPGEADNALVAWTVAYARSDERDDRNPDPGWLAIYATEKNNLLESLGIRQLQAPQIAIAVFEELW